MTPLPAMTEVPGIFGGNRPSSICCSQTSLPGGKRAAGSRGILPLRSHRAAAPCAPGNSGENCNPAGERSTGMKVLTGEKLIDGTGAGPQPGATVVVRDQRIEAVTTGPAG